MHPINRGIILFFVSLLAVHAQLSTAEEEHEYEQHGAHVHGVAKLLIAQEGNILEIEFHSPAMNIVGFEHQPNTESQHETIEKAMDTLGQPGLLFRLPSAAKCHPMSAEVETPLSKPRDHEHSHEHGDKHDHEDHDHSGETHSDFTAQYHFQCDKISQLDRIEIDLMKQFPDTEQIEVQTISPKGQQKIDLTPGKSTIEL
jgi:hypothetical protein